MTTQRKRCWVAMAAMLLAMLIGQSLSAQRPMPSVPKTQVAPAEQQEAKTRLSAGAAMLLSDMDKLGHDVSRKDSAMVARYGLTRQGCRYYVHAIVTRGGDADGWKGLKKYGVKTTREMSERERAVRIPTRRLKAMVDAGVVDRIDISTAAKMKR